MISNSADPERVDLRAKVLSLGGSIYYRYLSVPALSVLVQTGRVAELAQRSDVQSISPNRLTTRTASALELATGASVVRGGPLNFNDLTGSGVGIAVLDSGIAWNHYGLRDSKGASRVTMAVNVQQVGDTAVKGKDLGN